MSRFKEFLQILTVNLCNLLLVSLLLSLFSFPYGQISSHQYLKYNLYNTVIHLARSVCNQSLLIISIAVFFIFVLKRLVQFNLRSKQDAKKGKLSLSTSKFLLHLLILAVLYSVMLISSLLFLGEDFKSTLLAGPFEIILVIFTLGLFILFFFLNSRELLKSVYYKIASTVAVVIFVLVNLLSYYTLRQDGPNILFINVSSFRADFAGLGTEEGKNLPNLTELKRDSLFFTSFWANSSRTLPSLATIFTSTYPSKLNLNEFGATLSPRFLTLPELLKNEGYQTFGVVPGLFLSEKHGIAQGFDRYHDQIRSEEKYILFNSSSAKVSRLALEYLERLKEKKFFLFLHFDDPNLPYNPKDVDTDFSYEGDFIFGTSPEKIHNLIKSQKYSQDDIYYLKRCYIRELERVDRYVGLVLEELKKKKLYDNTLIIFTACHGEEIMERGFLGHGTSVYNEQLAIPLMIKLPALTGEKLPLKTGEVKVPFSLIDLLPTLSGVLDITNPQEVQGESILNNLQTGTIIFSEIQNPSLYGKHYDALALIKDDFKLIHFPQTGEFALYNLSQDTFEALDISQKEILRLEEMKKQLNRWIQVNRVAKKPPSKARFTPEENDVLISLGYLSP